MKDVLAKIGKKYDEMTIVQLIEFYTVIFIISVIIEKIVM